MERVRTFRSADPGHLPLAHVGAVKFAIRIGAGGIMVPNHAPLQIAEPFSSLEALVPDRVDLGLGRAPGTDPAL